MFGKRVVITGMGAVTPIGIDVSQYWKALVEGVSGVDRVKAFDPTDYPVQIAAEVKVRDLKELIPSSLPQCPTSHLPHRTLLLTIAAASQAVLQSGLDPQTWNPDKVGVYLGNGIGTLDFTEHAEAVKSSFQGEALSFPTFMSRGLEVFDPVHELEFEADPAIDSISVGWNINGPCSLSMTACAASAQAIGEASFWIGQGKADVIISGGAHSIIDPFGMTGFGHLTALSTRNEDPPRASRPFDGERDGFVLAEGSGMMILESEESARSRGAEILAEVCGYGLSTDAYRVTDPEPSGQRCIAAMREAVGSARWSLDDVDVINAHGTSTYANDRVETMAIKELFGERAYDIPVHAIKSMTGHSIAAAGVLEAIAGVLTLREGVLPPTINQEVPDPECDLDYVPNTAREAAPRRALSNSFGFGGQNVALALSLYS